MMKAAFATILALAALLGTGCQAAVPTVAAPAATTAATPKRALMGLHPGDVAPATGGSTDETASVAQWGLQFTSQSTETDAIWAPVEQLYYRKGLIVDRRMEMQIVDRVWRVGYHFTGPGELRYLGDARFAYRVPAGRILVINRAEGAGAIINSIPLRKEFASDESHGRPGVEALDMVFGEGQLVVFAMDKATGLYGYVADPAMRGLGGRVVAAAK